MARAALRPKSHHTTSTPWRTAQSPTQILFPCHTARIKITNGAPRAPAGAPLPVRPAQPGAELFDRAGATSSEISNPGTRYTTTQSSPLHPRVSIIRQGLLRGTHPGASSPHALPGRRRSPGRACVRCLGQRPRGQAAWGVTNVLPDRSHPAPPGLQNCPRKPINLQARLRAGPAFLPLPVTCKEGLCLGWQMARTVLRSPNPEPLWRGLRHGGPCHTAPLRRLWHAATVLCPPRQRGRVHR